MRLIGAIETRSLFNSLAAARRGFTFYLADSARLTTIALGGSGQIPPLAFCCSGRRVACISIFEVAADTAASTGKSRRLIAAVLLTLRLIYSCSVRRFTLEGVTVTGF